MLVVEDDPGIATQLVRGLSRSGYTVDHVMTGREALDRADPDVVLLDLGLPDGDGVDICRQLSQRSGLAIIVVTARGEEPERELALDAGADDYLVKPFGLAELLARIRAVLRRVHPGGGVLMHGHLVVDVRARRVSVAGREVALTPKEFDLLRYFVAHANKVLPHRELLQAVWGPDYGDQVDYLRVFVNQLRKKIEAKPSSPVYLLTEPWVGYRFHLPTGKP